MTFYLYLYNVALSPYFYFTHQQRYMRAHKPLYLHLYKYDKIKDRNKCSIETRYFFNKTEVSINEIFVNLLRNHNNVVDIFR